MLFYAIIARFVKLYTNNMYDKEFEKPLFNIGYYNNLNKQLEREVGDFLRANTNSPKLYSNDIRHQYASALYARNKGDKAAKFLGDANEVLGVMENGRDDNEVDKINNQIGIEYGAKYPDMPRGELLFQLLTDHDKNKARRQQQLQN